MTTEYSQFDWDAFMGDTLEASVAATGAWLRCLYKMRKSVTRGRISMPLVNYARLFGTSQDQAGAIISEISALGIGDAENESSGNITLTNRRLFREGMSATSGSWEGQKQANKGDTGSVRNATGHYYSSYKSNSNKGKREERKNVQNAEVVRVFTYWQTQLNHPKARLTTERSTLITARLRDGYSVEDLERAIDGCKASPYHMGQNDTSTIYDGIDLIFRSGTKVEKFIGYLRKADVPKEATPSQVGKYEPSPDDIEFPDCSTCDNTRRIGSWDSGIRCPDCVLTTV